MRRLRQFHAETEAATAVEYAVMMALILVVCFIAVRTFGNSASSLWASNGTGLDIAWQAAGGGS